MPKHSSPKDAAGLNILSMDVLAGCSNDLVTAWALHKSDTTACLLHIAVLRTLTSHECKRFIDNLLELCTQ
jgi:hypothetical protein